MQIKRFFGSNGFLGLGRVFIILLFLFAFSLYVIGKFAYLAISETTFSATRKETVQRGLILDRNAKQLAVPTNFWNFGVTPKAIQEKGLETFAKIIAPILGESEESIISKIQSNAQSKFVSIKKKIDQGTYEELRRIINLSDFSNGVRFDKLPGRIYPENELAAQLIGYMGDDGKGLSGIENRLNEILSPSSKQSDSKTGTDTRGKNIYLTIDANIQFNLEKIAREALTQTRAEGLMLIAAEAKTGEILSYISLPSPDLNFYPAASDEERRDRPAQDMYEPGSVFKVFSVASFLDTNAISENDIFLCDGVYHGKGFNIGCLHDHGWVDARGALAGSCNDALAQMSEHIESEDFLQKLRDLGFNTKTGVELPGEAVGLLRNPNDRLWSERSKPSIAIGQEIDVTALQMVQAATALANDGVPLQLTFIKKITDADGKDEVVHYPIQKERVLKSSTARYILDSMQKVTKEGTGHRADLGDVTIGTKTGTAQVADSKHGGYRTDANNSNCLAIFPVEDPEIILYILLETVPTIKDEDAFAGIIVTPIIKESANIIIDHLGMTRMNASSLVHTGEISIPPSREIVLDSVVPDFTGASKRQILPLLDRNDIQIEVIGDGYVSKQTPAPGTKITENMRIELYLE
ncbi:MAG: transpeptidase family protein [Treponema sp.]|nr:transpeptidase family protein [Treponema sp.]